MVEFALCTRESLHNVCINAPQIETAGGAVGGEGHRKHRTVPSLWRQEASIPGHQLRVQNDIRRCTCGPIEGEV